MSTLATTWSVGSGELDLTGGLLVGVLNVTPDSFSDGGLYEELDTSIAHALEMVSAGARVIDVGGESTRPGAEPVALDEEAKRALPVVRTLVERGITVSIDTYKPELAEMALEAGAAVVNDVTGFEDERMIEVVAAGDAGAVIMHGRGRALEDLPAEADVIAEVESYLLSRARTLEAAGVDAARIAVDPGLGFAKRHEQSLALLGEIGSIARHGLPVMVGASRKGFLRGMTGATTWEARDSVTAAISALTFLRGARLFRVHDVAKSRDALTLAGAIVANQ